MRRPTERQMRFVAELALSGNAAAAARAAGYSARSAKQTANDLLTNPDLQVALGAERAALAARMDLTRQDVINGLLEAVQRARDQQDPAAMIRGWAEVAKLCGFYPATSAKVQIAVEAVDPEAAVLERRLNSLSDAELVRLIEADRTPAETAA